MNNHIVETTEKVEKLEQDLISQEGKMVAKSTYEDKKDE